MVRCRYRPGPGSLVGIVLGGGAMAVPRTISALPELPLSQSASGTGVGML
jgi:hypothetical protein